MTNTLADDMVAFYSAQLGRTSTLKDLEREYFILSLGDGVYSRTWNDAARSYFASWNGNAVPGSLDDEAFQYYSNLSGLTPARSYSIQDHMKQVYSTDSGGGGGLANVAPITDNLELFLDANNPDGYQIDSRVSKNMLTANQASAETDTTGFTARGNTTIARNTTQFVHGAACIAATSVAAGGYGVNTTTTLGAVPVLPNTVYTIAVQMKAATVGRTVSVSINWWDAAGGFITGPGTNYTSVTTGWVLGTHTATSPSNAAFASLAIAPTTSGGAGEVHYFDNFGLWPGTSTDWVMPGKLQNINLLTTNQATVETDTTGLFAAQNCTIVRAIGAPIQGIASLLIASAAAGDFQAGTTQAASGIPVVAGKTYTGVLHAYAPTVTRSARARIVFYKSDGSLTASGNTVEGTSAALSTSWVQRTVTGVAPVDAAFAALRIYVIGAVAASEFVYIDQLGLWEGYSTSWVPPYRGIGTNGIQDGDPVPFLYDLSGKGRHASQATVASQPLYRKYDTAVSKNLLQMNSATGETDTSGWGAFNATVTRSTTTFYSGTASIQGVATVANLVNMTAGNGSSFRVPVTPGRTYKAVGKIRSAVATGATVGLGIYWYNAAGAQLTFDQSAVTALPVTTWTQFTSPSAVAPALAVTAEVFFAVRNTFAIGDTFHFDEVGIWEGTSTDWVAPDKPVRNLLTYNQASIETDTTGLTARGAGVSIARSTAQFTHGIASVAVTNPGTGISADWGVAPTGSGPSSSIPITAGTTYTFHAKVKAEAATGTIRIYLMWRNAAGSIISENSYVITTPTAGWDKLVTTQVAPALATGVTMAISRGTSSITYWVDELGIWEGSRTIWQPPVTLPNSKPAIQWTYPSSGALEALNGIVLNPTSTTFYVVCRLDTVGYTYTPRTLHIGGSVFMGGASGANFGKSTILWTTNPVGTLIPSSYAVISFRAGSALEIWYNGVIDGTTAAASGLNTTTWRVGSDTLVASGGVWPGEISAVLVYSAAHTNAQRQQIERWLGSRFGVTVA